jgi:hypothetical protein
LAYGRFRIRLDHGAGPWSVANTAFTRRLTSGVYRHSGTLFMDGFMVFSDGDSRFIGRSFYLAG